MKRKYITIFIELGLLLAGISAVLAAQ